MSKDENNNLTKLLEIEDELREYSKEILNYANELKFKKIMDVKIFR